MVVLLFALLPGMDLPVPLQVALVARRVVTHSAHKVFLPVVHRQVALQQRFPAEPAATEVAGVAVVVEDHGMFPERGFRGEQDAAALEHLGGGLVHGEHVSLEVVPPVRGVAALGAREQLPAVAAPRTGPAHRHAHAEPGRRPDRGVSSEGTDHSWLRVGEVRLVGAWEETVREDWAGVHEGSSLGEN